MGPSFQHYAFGATARELQAEAGSREAYARMDRARPFAGLGPDEVDYLAARDSFYLATVGANGWPYVQHRGGPPGFLQVLGTDRLAFPDYRGNRQYISVANLLDGSPVSLILVDYKARRRLKLWARATLVDPADDPTLASRLADPDYPADIERLVVLEVLAFDWNCPQHISPRTNA